MKTKYTQKIALLSILTALTLVLGYIHLPTLTGLITFLDVGIFFTAFYLGSTEGAIVGGLSGLLLDLLLGYPQWAFFSLVFHGFQGYVAGWSGKKRVVGLLLATLVMVGGYFVASMMLYNPAAAIDGLVGNIAQNMVGMALGSILAKVTVRARKIKV